MSRKQSKTPVDHALTVAKVGAKGLTAQRVARKSVKHYKRARRLPYVIGGAIVGFVLLKKLRGSGQQAAPPVPAPPIQTAPVTDAPSRPTPSEAAAPPAPPTEVAAAPEPAEPAEEASEPEAADDSAATIGEDLATAATESTGDTDDVPALSQEDVRAPAPDEETADKT